MDDQNVVVHCYKTVLASHTQRIFIALKRQLNNALQQRLLPEGIRDGEQTGKQDDAIHRRMLSKHVQYKHFILMRRTFWNFFVRSKRGGGLCLFILSVSRSPSTSPKHVLFACKHLFVFWWVDMWVKTGKLFVIERNCDFVISHCMFACCFLLM